MKRYDLDYGTGYSEHRSMVPRPNGEWVEFEEASAAITLAVSGLMQLCGHPMACVNRSIETGVEFCGMCRLNEMLSDALTMEQRYRERLNQFESYGITVASALKSREERDALAAENARLRAVLVNLLGVGHNLKAFAGTMLRWNEPGVDFSDEARRIVELAERNHATICEALAKVAP